jgi:hypothetical protein
MEELERLYLDTGKTCAVTVYKRRWKTDRGKSKGERLLLILGSVHFQCGELLGDEEETGVEKTMRPTNDNTAVRGCEKS